MIHCCYGCPSREVGCHAVCELYKTEKAKEDEWKERRRKQVIISREFREYHNKAVKNMMNHPGVKPFRKK